MRKLPIMSPQPMNLAMQGKLYSPSRDIAYVGITIVRRALTMMVEDEYLGELVDLGMVTENQVCDIAAALGAFFKICRDDKDKDVYAALEETKLLPELLDDPGEEAVLRKVFEGIGILVVGSAFNAIRDVNKPNEPPIASTEELVDMASKFSEIFKEKAKSEEEQ